MRLTTELYCFAERFIVKHNAFPSVKGYNGFRGSICPSVNNELVHGIPGYELGKKPVSEMISLLAINVTQLGHTLSAKLMMKRSDSYRLPKSHYIEGWKKQ